MRILLTVCLLYASFVYACSEKEVEIEGLNIGCPYEAYDIYTLMNGSYSDVVFNKIYIGKSDDDYGIYERDFVVTQLSNGKLLEASILNGKLSNIFVSYDINREELRNELIEALLMWKEVSEVLYQEDGTISFIPKNHDFLAQIDFKGIENKYADIELSNRYDAPYLTVEYQGKDYKEYMDKKIKDVMHAIDEMDTQEFIRGS